MLDQGGAIDWDYRNLLAMVRGRPASAAAKPLAAIVPR
jgi:hypothetical protein